MQADRIRGYVIGGLTDGAHQRGKTETMARQAELARQARLASTIQWVGGDNPVRKRTLKHGRYELLIRHYGKTVRRFNDAGGSEATLRNAIKRGLVELIGP